MIRHSHPNFIALLLCFALQVGLVQGQHPVSIRIGERDGLLSSTVYDLFQDSLGYIWMGTDIGLMRYDSYSFRHYDKSEVPSGAVAVLQTDARGRLWFMNFNSQILYLDGDSIRKFDTPPLTGLRYFQIIDDALYAYTGTSIYQFDIHTGEGRSIYNTHGDSAIANGLFPPLGNFTRHIVFSTRHHLLNYWSEHGIKKEEHLPEFIDPQTGGWDSRLVVLPDRVLIYGFDVNKLYEFRNERYAPIDLSPFDEAVKAIHYTSDGLLWFNTNDKLWVTDASYTPVFDHPLFTGNYVTDVILDDVGTYWFATQNNGVYIVPSLHNRHYSTENSNIADNPVQRLQRARNNDLLIGFPKGTVSLKRGGEHSFVNRKLGSEQEIQALFYLPEYESVLVSATLTFELPYDLSSSRLSDRTTIKEMVMDKLGNIWMASSEGAYVYTPANTEQRFPSFTRRFDKQLGAQNHPYKGYRFDGNRSRTVAYDSLSGSVYIGFADNLVKFAAPDWEQTAIRLENHPIVAADIVCKNGKVYAGTIGNGLVVVENDRVIEHYHSGNAPLFNYINAVAVTGNLVWTATDNGLFLLDETSGQWRTFKRSEGLISNEINDMAVTDGQLWLGTPLGLQSIPIHGLAAQKPVRVYIENVTTNAGEQVSDQARLSHAQNDIQVGIAGLSYPYNRDAQLEYRLLGQSESWTRIPASQRQVAFLGLPPGDYFFEIRPAGDAHATPASLSFLINKPFWLQTWFLLLIGTKLALLLYFIYHQRMKAQENKNKLLLKAAQLEAELRQSELTGIKSQMNPHFIFNALNSIQGYFLEDDKEKANEILGKFSDLMRKILYQSQQDCITLTEEIEALELYLQIEQARLGEEFTFELHNECNRPASDITIPSMIIQPFVENAVKHGLLHRKGKKWLRITFSVVAETLHIEIEDNGIGRKHAERINKLRRGRHQSFAISANQKRLELLNKNRERSIALTIEDKYDQAGRATGTLVLLNIPLETNE